jgi:putative tryptophan/tyrosine transport system substrate-binding protein
MGNANSAQAAKAATETIPIVFANGGDPIKLGLVSSLNRPGGNVTGVTFLNSDLVSKRLELLREVVPNVNLIAILTNPNNPNFEFDRRTIENSAQTLGRQLLVLKASTENEIETAFLTLAKEQAGGLLTGTDAFIASRRDQIVALAAKHFDPRVC